MHYIPGLGKLQCKIEPLKVKYTPTTDREKNLKNKKYKFLSQL